MDALDWAGCVYNGNAHRRDRFQSWLTHFALVLDFSHPSHCNPQFHDLWLLERVEGMVTFRPFCQQKEDKFHRDFKWNLCHHCDSHFPTETGGGSSNMICHIHELDYSLTRNQVLDFVEQQRRYK